VAVPQQAQPAYTWLRARPSKDERPPNSGLPEFGTLRTKVA